MILDQFLTPEAGVLAATGSTTIAVLGFKIKSLRDALICVKSDLLGLKSSIGEDLDKKVDNNTHIMCTKMHEDKARRDSESFAIVFLEMKGLRKDLNDGIKEILLEVKR